MGVCEKEGGEQKKNGQKGYGEVGNEEERDGKGGTEAELDSRPAESWNRK